MACIVGVAAGSAAAAEGDECVKIGIHATAGEKLSMDPAISTNFEDLTYAVSIYDSLLDLDQNFQPVPQLAESWESNADGTQWTFHLRKGVKFHDGTDFDAADVVHTYKRLIDPATASGAQAVLAFLDPGGIEAIDPLTVRFTTKSPVAELPVLLRNKFTYIVPDGSTHESLNERGVGTGPFIQESFTKGAPFNIVKRNPSYWAAGLPKAECLRISVIVEPTSRVAALIAGDVDLVPALDPTLARTLEQSSDVQVLKASGGNGMTLAMWVDTPPFDDVRVRQALKLVVDRQALVDTALLGLAEPGNDSPIPPSSPLAFSSEIPKRDIAKAKELLAAAGHPDGLEIDLYSSTEPPGALTIAQAFVQMAAEAGVRVNLIKAPTETYWSETWLKVPFLTSGWAARPPSDALAVAYRKTAKWPETHWFRDDYDALLDKANATVDAEERIALYKQAQKMLAEEGGAIIPAFVSVVSGLRAECSGYMPHASLNFPDWRQVHCK